MRTAKIEVPIFERETVVSTTHGEAWVVLDELESVGREITMGAYDERNKVHVILLENSAVCSRGDEIWVGHEEPSIVLKRHYHDCSQCHFLGRHEDNDLYFCPVEPTIIARYGADGDYWSGLVFGYVKDSIPGLNEALKRALCIPEFRDQITANVEEHQVEFPERIESFHKILQEVA